MIAVKDLDQLALSDIPLERIHNTIRDIPDFPKPGILFKDVTTVLKEPELFRAVIDYFALLCLDHKIDHVVGIESRGFILGAPLAYRLGASFIPVRKKGKLPGPTEQFEYELEYGTDCVEIHKDAIEPGSRVIIVDDLIATGGTAAASAKLVQKLGADLVGMLFMIELEFLNGKAHLPEMTLYNAMLKY